MNHRINNVLRGFLASRYSYKNANPNELMIYSHITKRGFGIMAIHEPDFFGWSSYVKRNRVELPWFSRKYLPYALEHYEP